jgi:hypothetical protein
MPYLPSTVRNVTLGPNGDTVIIHRTKPLNEHTTAELCDQLLFMAAYNGLLNGLTQHLTVQQQLDYDRQTEEIKALILERVQMGELGAPTTVVTPLIFPEMHRIAAEVLVRPTFSPGSLAARQGIRARIRDLARQIPNSFGEEHRQLRRELTQLWKDDFNIQVAFQIQVKEFELRNATTLAQYEALRAEIARIQAQRRV